MLSNKTLFKRRRLRVRNRLNRKSKRPRLSVFRSSKHIYAQVIDDTDPTHICPGRQLCGARGKPASSTARAND